MTIVGKQLTVQQFRELVSGYNFGSIKPTSIVIHHTAKPTKAQWRGAASIAGLKRYYEGQGWPAAPHLFIAEDGIWLFTPMTDVGIHCKEGNATWVKNGVKYHGYGGPAGSILKEYSLGIEVVGNYDGELWMGATKSNALLAIKGLMLRLGIPKERVLFHRDFPTAFKTCPGKAITKPWLFHELDQTP